MTDSAPPQRTLLPLDAASGEILETLGTLAESDTLNKGFEILEKTAHCKATNHRCCW